jgi:acetoin utilization protein AcuB
MTRGLVAVAHTTNATTAWRLMKSRRIRHLLVLDADRRLIGVVSDRDLSLALLERALQSTPEDLARGLLALRATEAMSWGVVTVHPGSELHQAARIMRERRLGSLPVADKGRIVGLVTATDVVDALMRAAGV